ncbi:hypothetical protein CSUNSWCD_1039 [Campylobacter showae CSUNSWCD]|uniref:Uncharacterized protein n=1 Tax=Campylobacter showae CSUNSWCD TaxID=1244083 RepID=M5ID71_9BACT|nr:hypothetical protein CSUNSWCD_1039 [Campylobacter showae CSUNSWCD]
MRRYFTANGCVDLMLGYSAEPTRSQYQTITRCDKNSQREKTVA